MNENTLIAIRAILEMDNTLTKILKAVKNSVDENVQDGNELDKCVTFTEAAKVLGKSRKRTQQPVANGSLVAVKFPGSSRASGVRKSSLRRLVNG